MSEGASFCVNCGAAAQGPRPPAATVPPPGAPPLQPRSGNPLMKALLIVLAVIVALGAMGIIGSIYVIHHVKRSVVSAAREHGVELRDFAASPYRGRMPDPCSLLTTSEASSILGVTIERAESHGRKCDYFENSGADPYFTVELNNNGRAEIAALKLALGAVKAVEPLSGIGDEAILGPMDSILVFTKDRLGVQIDFHQIGNGRDRAIAMARQMAGKL